MRLFPSCLLLAGSAALCARAADISESSIEVSFRPQDLPQKTTTCKALNRAARTLEDIQIEYIDVNPTAERTLLMVHGWPSLWHSWKFQVEEFKDDYRLIIPNNRGFANSTHPGDFVASGTWADMVGDLMCVLEHAGVNTAVCMGHDWGSELCYEAARMRPDRITAVLGAVVPYMPSEGSFAPSSALVPYLPRLAYQIYLGESPDSASVELNKDVRRTLRATLRTVASPPPETFLESTTTYLGAWKEVKEIPPIPFFTKEEEDYWVEQYSIQGFEFTLEFYTIANQLGSWEFIHAQGNYTIPQPALAILPIHDPVANWEKAMQLLRSQHFLPNLAVKTMDGAHWPQLEFPKVFNRFVREWLNEIEGKETKPQDTEQAVLHVRSAGEL
ncbi:uncharacterized protein FIBRA_07959 [Fibroporia radiculosa]|uniref:AB hydrolase-1 domain-containing protein n=1 Tax=Fibroporia radiculosa TaxID=599839 RepID=J4I1S7_9APHY|nr:uncharacterized protein FIBRA_07959 [Fibroporia radiculosa]CCM05727.1 predicted protein [Fibroporia radiculosa]